jgi:hypothetical protein
VGVGVGVGVIFTTVTVPVIAQHKQCGIQKYGNVPVLLKVYENVSPGSRSPEFQSPLAEHAEPEVVV